MGLLTRRALLAGLAALAPAACGGRASSSPAAATEAAAGAAPSAEDRPFAIYVASIGWHTGIAIRRDRIAATGLIPELADFPDASYVEFGWGDREYYTAADPSVFQALAAGMSPTPAVLHLIGMTRPPHRVFLSAEVVELPVSRPMLERLIAHIDAAFDRPEEGGPAEALPSALARGARFYRAHGEFHLFNTCNTWVARALSQAGLDISPGGVITADDLMRRVRDLPGARPPASP